MQADSMKDEASRRGYKNVIDALVRVAREEGFTKLYSGLYPNILRGMSVNAGMLACFDQAKEVIGEYVMKDASPKNPSLPTQLLASMVSGFTASFFSLPFDLLKSRMRKKFELMIYAVLIFVILMLLLVLFTKLSSIKRF